LTDGVDAPAEPGARAAAQVPAKERAPRRYRLRRSMLAALAIAVLVSVIVVERHTLAESLHVLARLNWAWFLLAFASEAISLSSFGLSRMLLMRVNGRPTTFRSVMAVTYAANALSISVPFAGAELAMVFSYRQFRRHGVDAATTGWTLAVSAIFSTSALALLLVIGAIAGSASLATAAGFLGAFVFLVPGAAVLLALRYESIRRLLHRLIAGLVSLSRRVFGVPAQGVDGLEEFLDRVASLRLPWFRYAEVFGLALLNWAADCGALACAIRAMGQPVPWHNLLLVYGAGAAVGSTGITPGGFALVELALTAALTAAGLHRSPALAAVLAYRLVNFWLVLIGGWILMAVLVHRRIGPAQDAVAEGAATAGAPRSAPGAGGLTCRNRPRSHWPTWRPTRIRRSPGCGPPGRSAGYPPSAPGLSPGTAWRSRYCGTPGRSPSMTRGSPPPRWLARACSRWTARSTCATGRPSPVPSGATRSVPGSTPSPAPRPNAWWRP
jgi:putative heme transporter